MPQAPHSGHLGLQVFCSGTFQLRSSWDYFWLDSCSLDSHHVRPIFFDGCFSVEFAVCCCSPLEFAVCCYSPFLLGSLVLDTFQFFYVIRLSLVRHTQVSFSVSIIYDHCPSQIFFNMTFLFEPYHNLNALPLCLYTSYQKTAHLAWNPYHLP